MRKMKRGICKYKGKLPLVCFYCGEIVHFSTKFPHKNKQFTKGKKGQRNFNKQGKKKGFKKKILSKEDSSSSEEETESDEENKERVFLMAKHNKMEEPDKEEDEDE